eukprot:jgi/Psemu1/312879/fgenesh1_kg.1044_\
MIWREEEAEIEMEEEATKVGTYCNLVQKLEHWFSPKRRIYTRLEMLLSPTLFFDAEHITVLVVVILQLL